MKERTGVDPVEVRAFVQRENLSSQDLDELVCDLCGQSASDAANQRDEAEAEQFVAAGERRASNINNGGLEEQVAFIASQFDALSEAMRAIMETQ